MSSKIISIRISDDAILLADMLAKEHGLSRSKLIEFLIQQSRAREDRSRDAARLGTKAATPLNGEVK